MLSPTNNKATVWVKTMGGSLCDRAEVVIHRFVGTDDFHLVLVREVQEAAVKTAGNAEIKTIEVEFPLPRGVVSKEMKSIEYATDVLGD
ncbi:hypothetical protein KJ713_01360 [Patescibacteria group bacterium]|nr:hypothetical protein [Patescibacteria group bacterium]